MTEYQDKEINLSHGDVLIYSRWGWFVESPKETFKFRCGPVPHTGKKRYGWLRYRNIKVRRLIQERARCEADGFRQRRDYYDLMDPWQEFARERKHCWKDYRKTQYKPLT